jgi:hypothetical protein
MLFHAGAKIRLSPSWTAITGVHKSCSPMSVKRSESLIITMPFSTQDQRGFMAQMILIDEFHLSVTAPRGLREPEYRGIRRTLDGKPFRGDLVNAVRTVFQKFPGLGKAKFRISR